MNGVMTDLRRVRLVWKKRCKFSFWMATTADEYELPLAVAMSAEELANIMKVKKNTIQIYRSRTEQGRIKGGRGSFRVFEVEVTEEMYKEMTNCRNE